MTAIALVTEAEADELIDAMALIGAADVRARVKQQFVAEFGYPSRVPTARLDEARQWVSVRVALIDGGVEEPAPAPADSSSPVAPSMAERAAALAAKAYGLTTDKKKAAAGGDQ